jgi:hypothetical protein
VRKNVEMAPLPPNSTARYKFHYTTVGRSHTAELRSTVSPAVAGLLFDNIVQALNTAVHGAVMDFTEFAASGSNVFNPVTTGFEGTTWGSGAGLVRDVPKYFNFIGRSAGGRRCRLTIFGGIAEAVDYRYLAGESPLIDAAVAALVAGGPNVLAIDGLQVVWKSYVNVGWNSHWQREVRP